jgi:hypothetical protein
MTGIYMRVRRDGSWQNIDIAELTQDELTAVFEPATKERVIMFLAAVTKWMRDNLVPVPAIEMIGSYDSTTGKTIDYTSNPSSEAK